VHGRIIVNDPSTAVAACRAGLGVAQPMALGIGDLLTSGELIELFPDWSGERFPLHVYHPSRHLPPGRVRAFLDFVAAMTEDQAEPEKGR
jgi:DNA-binding transcriptional LysR family regulator